MFISYFRRGNRKVTTRIISLWPLSIRDDKVTEGYDIEDGKKSVKIPVVQNYTSHAWARCFNAPSVNIEVTNLKYELRTLLS